MTLFKALRWALGLSLLSPLPMHAPGQPPATWPTPSPTAYTHRTPQVPKPQWGTFCGAEEWVRVDYYRPQMMVACQIVDEVWQSYSARAIVTGHGKEVGYYEHERLHKVGLATDFRIYNLRAGRYRDVAREAAHRACVRLRRVDPRFRVVLFLDDPRHKPHIHIEWRDAEEMTWTAAFWQGNDEACP